MPGVALRSVTANAPASPKRSFGVRTKIMVVGLVGLLGMLLVGAAGLYGMRDARSASADMEEMYQNRVYQEKVRYDGGQYQLAVLTYLRDLATRSATVADGSTQKAYDAAKAQLAKDLAEFPTKGMSQKGLDMLTDLRQKGQQAMTVSDEGLGLLLKGDLGGQAVLVGKATPAAAAFNKQLDAMRDAAQGRIVTAQANQADGQQRANLGMLGVLLICAAGALVVALRTSSRIVSNVNAVRSTIEALGQGDLTVASTSASADEVGLTARAAEAARTAMREVIGEVRDASVAVADSSAQLRTTLESMGGDATNASEELTRIAGGAEGVQQRADGGRRYRGDDGEHSRDRQERQRRGRGRGERGAGGGPDERDRGEARSVECGDR